MSSGWAGRPVLPTPEVALLTGPWILPNATLAALPVTLVARPSNSPLWFPYSTRPCDWSRRPLLCWLQPISVTLPAHNPANAWSLEPAQRYRSELFRGIGFVWLGGFCPPVQSWARVGPAKERAAAWAGLAGLCGAAGVR